MSEQEYAELVRIGDPVEADLLAAFLEDGEIEFQVVNRSGAGFMSQLMPRAQNPVVFRVLEEHLEIGKMLLEEYRTMQHSAVPADDEVPTEDQLPDTEEDT